MADISQTVNSTKSDNSIGEGKSPESTSASVSSSSTASAGGETNRTDPKVCHDPSITMEGIVRLFPNQNKVNFEEGEVSTNNKFEMTRVDGIEYPLVAVNDRNIENNEIISLTINYKTFLPQIELIIRDEHQKEQKINTTQMSSIIRVCIIATVNNVYRKLLLNFRTYDMQINESDPTLVTYYGTYYVKEFRQVNTRHIWMPSVCPAQPNCGQGGHINANTWEMLHRIAELTGLGFAATKKCKEIPDHVIRNIYTQRYDQFIEQQLVHCGTDEENIFDAWVDLYGYIVMVNVPWVFNEDITPDELTINAVVGIHGTSNDVTEQKPVTINRTLTNYNLTATPSNMEIASYNMDVDNDSISHGTLEQVWMINFHGNLADIDELDVQSKQDSVDGDFIEDYNTGKNRPIPKFNFNDDSWTGLSGGYDLHKQKIIRNAYFRKLRQSVLHVIMKNINLGLQRGTLVDIKIFDSDPINKKTTFANIDNLGVASETTDESNVPLPTDANQEDIIMDGGAYMPNMKLSGLYYIDGMTFEYARDRGRIVQILHLIKKGKTSGYENRHNNPRMPQTGPESTLPQDPPYETPA